MAKIPESVIDEIVRRANIVEIINGMVPLTKAGGDDWKACCPFHQEKTPSFHVSEKKQAFYCFGCQKGGNVITFLKDYSNLDYVGALRFLADRYHVLIPQESSPEEERVYREKRTLQERLYALHHEFSAWFMRELREHPGTPVAEYFKTRALDWPTADTFGIGAAPDSWDAGVRHGRALGFTEEELLAGGVVIRNESGRVYDRFRNRLIFTITDDTGRAVGFSAREIASAPDSPKYVNSPETPIFKKGQLLYALALAKPAIRKAGYAILCEGQLDVIAMHRAGLEMAVAPQGLAFTPEQANLLKRHADTIYLCFDSDKAGRAGTFRVLDFLLPLGMQVKALGVADGKDPDELFKTRGAAAVRALPDHARNLTEIIMADATARFDLHSAYGKSQAAAEALKLLSAVPDLIMREFYLRELGDALHIEVEKLFRELKNQRHTVRRSVADLAVPGSASGAGAYVDLRAANVRHAEAALLVLALQDLDGAAAVARDLNETLLSDAPVAEALREVMSNALNDEWLDGARLLERLPEAVAQDAEVVRLIFECRALNAAQRVKVLAECVGELRREQGRLRRRELLDELKSADAGRQAAIIAELKMLRD